MAALVQAAAQRGSSPCGGTQTPTTLPQSPRQQRGLGRRSSTARRGSGCQCKRPGTHRSRWPGPHEPRPRQEKVATNGPAKEPPQPSCATSLRRRATYPVHAVQHEVKDEQPVRCMRDAGGSGEGGGQQRQAGVSYRIGRVQQHLPPAPGPHAVASPGAELARRNRTPLVVLPAGRTFRRSAASSSPCPAARGAGHGPADGPGARPRRSERGGAG